MARNEEESPSRDGNFTALTAPQCRAFREYVRRMGTAALETMIRDYECRCSQNAPLREQFEWKRNVCRQEVQRRITRLSRASRCWWHRDARPALPQSRDGSDRDRAQCGLSRMPVVRWPPEYDGTG